MVLVKIDARVVGTIIVAGMDITGFASNRSVAGDVASSTFTVLTRAYVVQQNISHSHTIITSAMCLRAIS